MSKQTPRAGSPYDQFTRTMFTRIIAGLARMLRDEELTVAQVAAIHLIEQEKDYRVSSLADALLLSQSAASRLVDGLVQRGLVERTEHPDDRRAKALSISAKGRSFIDRASEDRLRIIFETVNTLPATLVSKVVAAVGKIRPR